MNDVFKYERRKEKIGVRIRQERRKLPGRVSQEALGERLAQVIPTRDNIKTDNGSLMGEWANAPAAGCTYCHVRGIRL